MKPELQERLLKKYPEFFDWLQKDQEIKHSGDVERDVQELLEQKSVVMPIQFGFECGDGWYMLLDELMGNIQNHIENVNWNRKREMRWRIGKWLQVKSFRISHKRLNKFMKWLYNKVPRGVEPMRPIQVVQVKEKFGGLRYYYNGGDDQIFGMVTLAESVSYYMCENCGSTKNVGQTSGWITTLCKECAKGKRGWREYEEK